MAMLRMEKPSQAGRGKSDLLAWKEISWRIRLYQRRGNAVVFKKMGEWE